LELHIDFFMTKASIAEQLETSTELTTTSDHVLLLTHLRCGEGERVKVSRKVTQWDMDGLKLKEEKEHFKKAEKQWRDKSSKRTILNENSRKEELQREAEWVEQNFVNNLDRYCKKVKVCPRWKRWWIVEIAEKQKILVSTMRARKRGEATQQQVKKQRRNL
jgi:hypothetical protein